MKEIKVAMTRDHLENIPAYSLPDSFQLKFFEDGNEVDWARIETAADEFESEEKALERFNRDFSSRLDELKERCLFIENNRGELIGTTMGWYGDFEEDGNIQGRIHWVSILPEYQGQGLAKPLFSAAMNILANNHEEAYLTSQTTSYKAINMYLQYGFEPVVRNDLDIEAWKIIEDKLNKQILV